MADTTFDGVAPVVAVLAARLTAGLPAELARLEDRDGRPVPLPDAGELDLWRPPVVQRTDRALLQPEDYPAVLVVPQNTGPAVIVDMLDGAPLWQIPYTLRVWAFARYFGADDVVAMRDRLAVAILATLFRAPRLDATRAVALDGWRQSFSDVGVDDNDASTVAGWWLELTVNAYESVSPPALASADVVGVAVHPEAD